MLKWAIGLALAATVMGCSAPAQVAPAANATATPIPATATPPELNVQSVVAHFKAAGLPLGNVVELTAENDPNKLLGRPKQYVAKAFWVDARLGAAPANVTMDAGGSVELFGATEDMAARKAYIEAIAAAPLFAEYTYGRGRVLIRLPKAMTPGQAQDYEKALNSLKGA